MKNVTDRLLPDRTKSDEFEIFMGSRRLRRRAGVRRGDSVDG